MRPGANPSNQLFFIYHLLIYHLFIVHFLTSVILFVLGLPDRWMESCGLLLRVHLACFLQV